MKKKTALVLGVALLCCFGLAACKGRGEGDKKEENCFGLAACKGRGEGDKKEEKEELTKITLNEVAHSIFYAPQYVAIEKGYFKEEGIDLNLVTGFGADKVMAAVLSGDVEIGFMGSESSIYAYQQGANDKVINFAQLTQRAGNFLVSREKMPEFQWEDLKGKEILGGRKGGMPEMVFEYILKEKGQRAGNFLVSREKMPEFQWEDLKGKEILGGRKGGMPEMVFEYILKEKGMDPDKDMSIDRSIDFGSTAAAFSGGQGDFSVEFEPSATALEKEGAGYVVASCGVESGYVPYTAYSARESYIKENSKILQGFTNALQKGMDYVNSHTPEEIAGIIQPQFKESDLETITTIVKRYQEQNTWKENLIFEKESFELLEDILDSAGELKERVPYQELVNTDFAEKAADQ